MVECRKKSGLKRKVTGAGMFSFLWKRGEQKGKRGEQKEKRGAQKDTEQYRNGYPVSILFVK
jgi:hypothetical protein